jgi:hypothetical protein
VRRDARGHALAPKRTDRGVVLAYVGEDEAFRETIIELDPVPGDLELSASGARGRWRAVLEPGEPVDVLMSAEPSIAGRRRRRLRRETAAAALERLGAEWSASCTRPSW